MRLYTETITYINISSSHGRALFEMTTRVAIVQEFAKKISYYYPAYSLSLIVLNA
jgi:hypothetical protein